MTAPVDPSPEVVNAADAGHLPGLLGLRCTALGEGTCTYELTIREALLAINGFLHAGTVVTLADTTAGCGTLASLPEGASGFTTVELKCNMLGTAREGRLLCHARRIHAGRSTQVWDSTVISEASGKTIAEFRCTQMILYPR